MGGLVAMRGCRDILEIGTLLGYSALHLAEAAGEDGHVDTVDIRKPERTWGSGDVVRDLHLTTIRLIEESGLAERITLHAGNSAEILPAMVLDGRSFEFIYIDGDHRRPSVTLDFINAFNLLAPGESSCSTTSTATSPSTRPATAARTASFRRCGRPAGSRWCRSPIAYWSPSTARG